MFKNENTQSLKKSRNMNSFLSSMDKVKSFEKFKIPVSYTYQWLDSTIERISKLKVKIGNDTSVDKKKKTNDWPEEDDTSS